MVRPPDVQRQSALPSPLAGVQRVLQRGRWQCLADRCLHCMRRPWEKSSRHRPQCQGKARGHQPLRECREKRRFCWPGAAGQARQDRPDLTEGTLGGQCERWTRSRGARHSMGWPRPPQSQPCRRAPGTPSPAEMLPPPHRRSLKANGTQSFVETDNPAAKLTRKARSQSV